jgi:hypothetical protein
MGKQQETAFKEKFLPRLKSIPYVWALKTQEMAKSGVPDILACVGGLFVAIELKTETGEVSKLQEYNLDGIVRCGGYSLVVTPETYEPSLEFLAKLAQYASDFMAPDKTAH